MIILYMLCFLNIVFAEDIAATSKPVSTWENIRAVVEFLYFLSGIFIAVFAYKALGQIKIGVKQVEIGIEQLEVAKNDLKIRVERETATMTALQCERYASEVIPMSNTLEKHASAKGLIYDGKVIDFKMSAEISEWFKKYDNPLYETIPEGDSNYWEMCEFLNKLEGISIYFTSGICDEKIAFDCLAEIFCEDVQRYYPLICYSNDEYKQFQNVIKLYELWNNKRLQLKLKEKAGKSYDDFVQAETAASTIVCKEITPIGIAAATRKTK